MTRGTDAATETGRTETEEPHPENHSDDAVVLKRDGIRIAQPAELPDTWRAVDAEPPADLPQNVTPRRLQRAAEDADTLFDVQQALRAPRPMVSAALTRLGIRDSVESATSHSVHRLQGDD